MKTGEQMTAVEFIEAKLEQALVEFDLRCHIYPQAMETAEQRADFLFEALMNA